MTESVLLFILGSSGLTIIITSSVLFLPVRKYFNKPGKFNAFMNKLLNCAMCLGFHIGVIMFFSQGTIVYDILCAAGTISIVSWVTVMKI